ncbi:hypothetical protein K435DRAFT_151938 [Dendrothele bispora CBS 962.96]|uniref:Phospholipid/glycerol acyltransferase domain-containing protein n=1 Tax=Dendrothele bispora (strain CBS 962.96) TaxID=1314807 RepID=A0A4S8LYN5_DENBC|nr:hypothetical protein K435DRAFT_151938 [Dendrothele bispora CBS 962.96]
MNPSLEASMAVSPPVHAIPISRRPSTSWTRKLWALVFIVLFDLGCLTVNASQFVFLLPFRILPFKWSRALYEEGIRYTKGSFGCLLILMCQLFSPTKFLITFETEGKGAFTKEDIDRIVVRDKKGNVVSLDLPTKFVCISNHQVYADWWYAWCLFYYLGEGVHRYIYITLKKSLQWVPVVGWGMQFFNFIFLARSWASDRVQLATSLSALGQAAEQQDNPFVFLLYPEGTLVSKDTRPISRKFADKMGINDMINVLLPRSMGLLFSLRSLSPRVKGLKLIDLTLCYPGIPPLGYGQSYYTLRSMFLDGVAPPALHIHLRMFDVAKDVPIGDLTGSNPTAAPETSPNKHTVEVDIPEIERESFDLWLRQLWQEKDESITRWLEKEKFSEASPPAVEIPLKLKRTRDYFDAFGFFIPAALGYVWGRVMGMN